MLSLLQTPDKVPDCLKRNFLKYLMFHSLARIESGHNTGIETISKLALVLGKKLTVSIS